VLSFRFAATSRPFRPTLFLPGIGMPCHVGGRPGNLASPCHILSIVLLSISSYLDGDRLCAYLPLNTCTTVERRFVALALGLPMRIVALPVSRRWRYRKIEWRRGSRRGGAQRHLSSVSHPSLERWELALGNKISSKLGHPIFVSCLIIRTISSEDAAGLLHSLQRCSNWRVAM
jgi:hypothetical protein